MKQSCSILTLCFWVSQFPIHAQPTNLPGTTADTLVISAAKPLATSDTDLRQALYKRCREMLDAPAG
jgi:hypothetical protein